MERKETIPVDETDRIVRALPAEALAALDEDAERAGGAWEEPADYLGSVGRTMYDSPTSVDHSVTVLLPREHLERVPSQSLVRIWSLPDRRTYLGIVTKGPFAEPDGLRADAPLVVTTTVRGGIFMPRYHGRVQVELLGAEIDGALEPPRFRPLPNSPVFVLDEAETAAALAVDGDLRLGLAVGHENVPVGIPSDRKSVLPRHTGIIGTTGGGKSTTVAGFVAGAQRAGFATILLDIEGEYTYLGEPTDDPQMQRLLHERGLRRGGVSDPAIFHLIGRESSNPNHANLRAFALQFSQLSPYAVAELLDLSDAQQERYWQAYDATKTLLRRLRLSTADDLDLDEFESGFPGMTLAHLIDVAAAFEAAAAKSEIQFRSPAFAPRADEAKQVIQPLTAKASSTASWRALLGKLGRLRRLDVFDRPGTPPLDYAAMLRPGQVSIVDLSDTDSPVLNNLAIADILRGIQRQQEIAYEAAEAAGRGPPRTLVIVEEAHEFLAKERIDHMPNLFAQVARIAKRGRKRWLGLVFVTQLPQHLPNQLIGLVNNWIIHKISDAGVVSSLKRSVSGIDDSLWDRLPGLAPGQAIVSCAHMQRPVLTAIDPTPAKLRMVE
jgi:DNA helicase HerA-like ATPase